MVTRESTFRPLTHVAQDGRAIAALAVPLILTHLAHVAVTTTDIVMLGFLGAREVATGGLAIAIFNQFRTMGTGLVTGTSNLVAAANSRGDEEQIRKLVRASLTLSTLAAVAFAILLLLIEQPLLWLGQDPEIAAQTAQWLAITAPAMLPCLWFQSLRHFTVGMKKPGPLLAITLISVALTAALNYALIFGRFGLPRLGLLGVACSTSIVMLLTCAMFLAVVVRQPSLTRLLSLTVWRIDKEALRSTWNMGVPIAATYGLEAGFFSVITLMVGALGSDALAAQTIVNQAVYIVFMISAGISHASSINISDAYARADYARSRRFGHVGTLMGIACMAIIAVIYWAAPKQVISLFLDPGAELNESAFMLAVNLLAIAAVLQFFDCAQNVGAGILRGIGDVRSPLRFSIVGYWFVGLPCAYAAGILFDTGIYGIWLGLMVGLATTAVLQWRVFERRLLGLLRKTEVANACG